MADFNERQRLKQLEDSIVDVQLILDSTLDTVETMLVNYTEMFIKTHPQNEGQSNFPGQDLIIRALQEKRREVKLLKTKVEALRTKLAGTTELVSTLLTLSNGHSLKSLAEESKVENATMRVITERGFRDAVAVKVLTIVTLVYLPTTVVAASQVPPPSLPG
ncbi:hypothetical protein PV11_08272 [Exophiala sideris]|uniref:Uncharacterized protein n=1 Tax=Exophiala sideris TaxID=1016849 RepID=A0A0D1X008_9EURO|nr:hypothetical protein PV11_08272 [Exophiala sideris]